MRRLLPLLLALAACAHGVGFGAKPQEKGVFRFRIGDLEAIAVKDGEIHLPNDGKVYGVGQPVAAVAALLGQEGLSTETIDLDIQPLLVRDGKRVMLFDTGAADASFARAGRLPASLRSAGIAPSEITDVFVSHGDPDHVSGLVTAGGALAFPNARIHLSSIEWTAMQAHPEQPALVAAMASHVDAFPPGASLLPTVTARALHGHTPGHSAYEIASGADRLLFIGDVAHHSVISVQRPDWTIAFDQDDGAARAARRALLQEAADRQLHVYAVHFPFPGLGHVRAKNDTFVWVPDAR